MLVRADAHITLSLFCSTYIACLYIRIDTPRLLFMIKRGVGREEERKEERKKNRFLLFLHVEIKFGWKLVGFCCLILFHP